jgi:hypothetical protein
VWGKGGGGLRRGCDLPSDRPDGNAKLIISLTHLMDKPVLVRGLNDAAALLSQLVDDSIDVNPENGHCGKK